MATLTIRNLTPRVVRSLRALAARNHRSMEQEVRELLEMQVGDRLSAIAQIKKSWPTQARTPSAEEIEAWRREGRA